MGKTVKQILKERLIEATGDREVDVLIPPDSKLGDYSTNAAFKIAKKLASAADGGTKAKPVNAANDLKNQIEADLSEMFDIQVAPNGFLNFYTKLEFSQNQLGEISKDETYGQSEEGQDKKVIVEYSSTNIAKPAHIGHLRSMIIGDSLASIYEKLGYKVVRWDYVGDWGTQFGKVIAGYKKWGENKKEVTMADMLEWYVKATKELPEDEGAKEFKKLESGDSENRKLWQQFKEASLGELGKTYKKLNLHSFDVTKGESSYESELKPIIEWLEKEKKIKESEGAMIFELEKYNLPPALLQKSDGATLYMTRDLAGLGDRLKEYKPAKIFYVVSNQQALHFQQVFAIAKDLNMDSAELVHVKYGMVLGEDGKKLATREGKVVPLQEVIDKITEMAHEAVKQKNSDLSGEEMERVAHVVAIGALKYNDLKQHPYSDIEFDWKAMLDLSGNSGPYIQYTYARLVNILNKAGEFGEGDLATLVEPSEKALMRQLLDYPEAVKESAERYALNSLALYLYDLAHLANQFYEKVHVLEDENNSRRSARLLLIKTVSRTLKDGLSLLGIETLERI